MKQTNSMEEKKEIMKASKISFEKFKKARKDFNAKRRIEANQ